MLKSLIQFHWGISFVQCLDLIYFCPSVSLLYETVQWLKAPALTYSEGCAWTAKGDFLLQLFWVKLYSQNLSNRLLGKWKCSDVSNLCYFLQVLVDNKPFITYAHRIHELRLIKVFVVNGDVEITSVDGCNWSEAVCKFYELFCLFVYYVGLFLWLFCLLSLFVL